MKDQGFFESSIEVNKSSRNVQKKENTIYLDFIADTS